MQSKRVLVIIPAYNEEANIASVVAGVPKKLKAAGGQYATDILVIDDGSRDKTFAAARKTRATVLRHIMNSGAGAATRTGFRYAGLQSEKYQYIATIDADGQHATDDIRVLIEEAERTGADMVIGNRLHVGNRKDMPLHRTLGNKGLSLISRILFGIRTKDTQSGLRLVRADKIHHLADYTIDRYGFCTELLWLAVRNGMDVREAPITVKYSVETLANGQSNWGVIDLIMDLLWIRLTR